MFHKASKPPAGVKPAAPSSQSSSTASRRPWSSNCRSNLQNGDITKLFAANGPPARHAGTPSSTPSRSFGTCDRSGSVARVSEPTIAAATAAEALKLRPTNIEKLVPSKTMMSIYDKLDSFAEDSDQMGLTKKTPTTTTTTTITKTTMTATGPTAQTTFTSLSSWINFDEGDFSDDDKLDLDFHQPSALPAAKPPAKPDAGLPYPSSAISWPPSSAPQEPEPPPSQRSTSPNPRKREARERAAINDSLPEAKRRQLPNDYYAKPLNRSSSRQFTTDTANEQLEAMLDAKDLKCQTSRKSSHGRNIQDNNDGTPSENPPAPIKVTSTRSRTKPAFVKLSREQEAVKRLVCQERKSIFFTGPAGTGKSVLMRSIIDALKNEHRNDPERVTVTASTGLAACNIGGMTLHSFAGIGLGKDDVAMLVRKVRRNPKAKNRWLKARVLIIDEISMVDGELFDKLDHIGRVLRNNGRPWGGIQLVITGDFFQLPPVPEGNTRTSTFAFEAKTWKLSIDHTIGLTEVFRQRDPVFANMLNEMRLGKISIDTIRNFTRLSRPLECAPGLETTELFPTRMEVDSSNERRMKALQGKEYCYNAIDTAKTDEMRDRLLQNMMVPKQLVLKKGAQVMLVKNVDDTLVNGSLGTVIDFMDDENYDIADSLDSDMGLTQKKRFEAFRAELSHNPSRPLYPLVRFHGVDGHSRDLLCHMEEWKVELPNGEVEASRKQVPLILAWALSIHKAQGQTLERVKVDLGKVFEKGQAYVALSRATTQDGLQVLNFRKEKIMAHPRVVAFYNQLHSIGEAGVS